MVNRINITSDILNSESDPTSRNTNYQSNQSNQSNQRTLKYRGSAYSLQGSKQISSNSVLSIFRPPSSPTPMHEHAPLMQKFLDLPIGRKQLLALLVCELVPILGFTVGTFFVLNNDLRTQLANQAKSEVAVNETNYNMKLDEMQFGSRGQSDNPAIIAALKTDGGSESLSADTQKQLRQILQNQTSAGKIEYATLVGKDLRIVANANAQRQGEKFDPDGLVSEVLKSTNPIKANAIVPWKELAKESAPLPVNFNNQDALVRYVVTPVKDPNTQAVIGALVYGDIVNNKPAIIENALNTWNGGYSAVYLRQPNGEFTLATGVDQGNSDKSNFTYRNIPLPDTALLQIAANNKGESVTGRMVINGVSYTVAAKAVPNKIVGSGNSGFSAYSSKPTAILVRGTPEDNLSYFIRASLLQGGTILSLGVVMILLWSAILRRAIVRPIENLEETTQSFANGDRAARAEVFYRDEVGQLAIMFNYMADGIVASEQALTNEAERQQHQAQEARLLSDVIANIRRSLKVEDIIRTSVNEIREFMRVERVLLYRFNEDFKSGVITAEAVLPGWIKAYGQTIHDPLSAEAFERFNSGKVSFINNWKEANLTHCHCEILEQLQVKANMVAPIRYNNQLFGLLCAHSCSAPWEWQETEIDFFEQLAAQIGYALDQADLLTKQEDTSFRTRQLYDITLRLREKLERQRIFNVAVQEVRQALGSDRAVVYMFDEKWQGTFVAESVARGFPVALGSTLYDPCFAERYVEKYKQGRVQATPNIYEAGLNACHLDQLKQFEVKANLVAPILANNELLGLLIVHQCSTSRVWRDSEIEFFRQIALQLGYALDQADLLKRQEEEARLSRLLNEITLIIRQNLAKEDIPNIAVREMRRVLNADRVIIYTFNPDMTGTVTAEAVGLGWGTILGETVTDPFREGLIEQYKNGRVRVMHDIYAEGLTECHRELLEGFQIRASMTAPFMQRGQLLGLMCVHQCSGPREWKEAEANFFRQASVQLGFALEQATLFEEKEQSRLQAEVISIEQRQQKELLQRQLVELLGDVEGVAMGDLTVRADVTVGDIGTVADFFNSIVESLRQIVTQVKQSALQVNAALGENEGATRALADEALRQAQETMLTLESVEHMTDSIRAVAESAHRAAEVTRTASMTAEAGGSAMDLTVQNILALRDTIGETAKKVKRLGESSQQISKVVSLINQIALQTNLLAINAGIEAARAGEEGQGFAVVAEEVGELAARSAAATREIEQIVETIQRETGEVVEAMEQGTTQVVEGTYLVENAKQSLGQILEVSRQIDSLVQSISEATVSQVQTSQTITQLMEKVAQVAEHTSKSSLQVSESLRQTVEVAKDLQESVGTFKVS